jgi:hypothetical protein
MDYRPWLRRFIKDPRTLADFFYWGIRGIRPIPLFENYTNDHGALEALALLAKESSTLSRQTLDEFVGTTTDDEDTAELGRLMTKYGSDKATKHDYYRLYAHLLKAKRNQPVKTFEIGLGTNNPDVPSNMGVEGKPGASLRGLRDWAPQAEVFGADVDPGCLFEEERIKTFFVDQTDPTTLKELAKQFSQNSFDLIIDDGLHNTHANFNTLNWALPLIKDSGTIVIEDIVPKYIESWEIAAALLSQNWNCILVKCRSEWVFIVTKK